MQLEPRSFNQHPYYNIITLDPYTLPQVIHLLSLSNPPSSHSLSLCKPIYYSSANFMLTHVLITL